MFVSSFHIHNETQQYVTHILNAHIDIDTYLYIHVCRQVFIMYIYTLMSGGKLIWRLLFKHTYTNIYDLLVFLAALQFTLSITDKTCKTAGSKTVVIFGVTAYFYGFQLRFCYTKDLEKALCCNCCCYLMNRNLLSSVSHIFISAVPWRISDVYFCTENEKKKKKERYKPYW